MTTRPDFPPDAVVDDQKDPSQSNLPAVPEEQDEIVQKALAYRAINSTPESLQRIMNILQKNLGGQRLGLFDLPRVTMPPQGLELWSLPNTSGEAVYEKTIEGIITDIAFPRAYWRNAIQEGRTPPNCSSPDGIRGLGKDPGGDCETCQYNQWGTSQTGSKTGKACREQRLLFLLRPDDLFPLIVQVPPTSLDVVKDYCISLSNEFLLYSEVFTSLSIAKVDNGGNPYGRLVMSKSAELPEQFRDKIQMFIDRFTPLITAPAYTPDGTEKEPNPAVAETTMEVNETLIVDGNASPVQEEDELDAALAQAGQASFLDDPGKADGPAEAPDLPF